MRRREKLFWLIVGAALVVGFVFLIPAYGQFCAQNKDGSQDQCASYHVALVAVWHIAKFLDDHEWLEQPGLDIHSASETSAIYVPDDFILAEKIAVDGVVPKTIGISVIIHYTWSDVFGKSFIDFASFAGVAEVGDAKANQKRHPLNTSPWFCGLNPIAKGESWSGIAVRAPRDAADD